MERMKNVNLLWVFQGSYSLGNYVKLHTHFRHYNLIFVEKGAADFELDGTVYEASDDDCLLIPPGIKHSLNSVHECGLHTIDIKFITQDASLKRILSALPLCLHADTLTRELIIAIKESANDLVNSIHGLHANNSYLLSLLFHLGTPYMLDDTKNSADFFDDKDKEAFSPITQQAILYLSERLDQDTTLSDLAVELRYNKNYICGVFRKDTGMTINDYLTRIRIRRSMELLAISHLSLDQVAQSTGFHSVSSFIRTFKQSVGIPPGMYRRNHSFENMLDDLGDITLSTESVKALTSKKVLHFERTDSNTVLYNNSDSLLSNKKKKS